MIIIWVRLLFFQLASLFLCPIQGSLVTGDMISSDAEVFSLMLRFSMPVTCDLIYFS